MNQRCLVCMFCFAVVLTACQDTRTERQSEAWERVSRKYCQKFTHARVPKRIGTELLEAKNIARAKEGWGTQEEAPARQCRAALRHIQQARFELAKVAGLADALWFSMISKASEPWRNHLTPADHLGLQPLRDLVIAFDTCHEENLPQLAEQIGSTREEIAKELKQATERCGSKYSEN